MAKNPKYQQVMKRTFKCKWILDFTFIHRIYFNRKRIPRFTRPTLTEKDLLEAGIKPEHLKEQLTNIPTEKEPFI